MSQPDLFVVCKNCGSEVSPYITECPYCGEMRKRAPKIDRSGGKPQPKRRGRAKLPRLRAEEIAGIAPDTQPYVTFGLLLVCAAAMLVFTADQGLLDVLHRRAHSGRRLALVRLALPARRPARLRVRGAGRRRHLRIASRAALRPRRPAAHIRPRRRRRRRSRRDARDAAAVRRLPAVPGVRRQRSGARDALRLARGRPAGGTPRRRPRERPARRLRDRSRPGALIATTTRRATSPRPRRRRVSALLGLVLRLFTRKSAY